jgi:hypothetical protein
MSLGRTCCSLGDVEYLTEAEDSVLFGEFFEII